MPSANFRLKFSHPRSIVFMSTWQIVVAAILPPLIRHKLKVCGPVTYFMTAVDSLAYTGEFEKHAGCWMGWPDSGYLWRDGAAPAQEQYANIAKAIAEFEPLTMFANAGPVRTLVLQPCPTRAVPSCCMAAGPGAGEK